MGFKTWIKSYGHGIKSNFGGKREFKAHQINFSEIKKGMLFTLEKYGKYVELQSYVDNSAFSLTFIMPSLKVYRKENDKDFTKGFVKDGGFIDTYTPVEKYSMTNDFKIFIYSEAPYNFYCAHKKHVNTGHRDHHITKEGNNLNCRFVTCGYAFELHESKQPETKKCPYCAEEIKYEAIVCRYCNRDLD